MRKKSIIIVLILIIASAGIGTGVSLAADTLQTNANSDIWYDLAFTDFTASDNESDKDVATPTVIIIDDHNLQISIDNAYPGYAAYIDFTITNIGEGAVILNNLVIQPYNTDALLVELADINNGDILFIGESIIGQLTVEVQQDAEMNSYYPFEIIISFGDYIE